jgi:hypothetical protein
LAQVQLNFILEKSGASPIINVYYGLFIFALLFQFVGAIDASVQRNTIQVIAVAGFNVFTFCYSIIQIFQTNSLRACVSEFSNIVGKTIVTRDTVDRLIQLNSKWYSMLNEVFLIQYQTLVLIGRFMVAKRWKVL